MLKKMRSHVILTAPTNSEQNQHWSALPHVLFDIIASFMSTHERLIILEHVCHSYHGASNMGWGWRYHLNLSFIKSTALIQLGDCMTYLGTRLKCSHHLQYVHLCPKSQPFHIQKLQLSNVHTLIWPARVGVGFDDAILLWSSLPSLTSLTIIPMRPPLGSEQTVHLTCNEILRSIIIHDVVQGTYRHQSPRFNLTVMGRLPHLHQLELGRGCFLDHTEIKEWSSPLLSHITFQCKVPTELWYNVISSCQHIHTLSDSCLDAAQLHHLVKLHATHLRSFCLHQDHNDLSSVAKLTRLTHLTVDGSYRGALPTQEWLHLTSLTSLQTLDVAGFYPSQIETIRPLIYALAAPSSQMTLPLRNPLNDPQLMICDVTAVGGSLQSVNNIPCHEWLRDMKQESSHLF
jgi:hypothetical protein